MAFLEILNDNFLTQLNFIPTCRDRVLDLAITNVPDRVRVREVLSPKESDVFPDHAWHGVFSISRPFKSYSQNKRTVYDYSNGVFDRLRWALEALNLCNLIQDSDDDNLDWTYWKEAFMSAVSDFIPTKKFKGKNAPPSFAEKWGCLLKAEEISYRPSTTEVSRIACKGQDFVYVRAVRFT